MENAIIIIVLALVLGLSIAYIVKAKKSGAKCIGCSSRECNCGCDCYEHTEKEEK